MDTTLARAATPTDSSATGAYPSSMETATVFPKLPSITTAPATRPSPGARFSRRRRGPRTLHMVLRTVKGLFLIAEITAALLLLGYSGLVKLLPATPPAAHVYVANAAVNAPADFYCWLTPGHGLCADASAPAPAQTPSLTAHHGATLLVTLAPPAPTTCAVTATNANDLSASGVPLRTVAAKTGATSAAVPGYLVAVSLSPGSYLLTLNCTWTPRPTMRWLDGQGAATYALSLRVTP